MEEATIFTRFTLIDTRVNEVEAQFAPNKILEYESNDTFNEETTRQQIYDCYRNDIDSFHDFYQNSNVEDQPVNVFSYVLTITGDYNDEIDDTYHRVIYHVEFNRNNELIREQKFYLTESPAIRAPYKVYISVGLYSFEEPQDDLPLRLTDILEITDEFTEFDEFDRDYELKKTIKEEECVICYERPSNVLYTDCGHIPTCKECEDKGNIQKCPICRTKVTKDKFII